MDWALAPTASRATLAAWRIFRRRAHAPSARRAGVLRPPPRRPFRRGRRRQGNAARGSEHLTPRASPTGPTETAPALHLLIALSARSRPAHRRAAPARASPPHGGAEPARPPRTSKRALEAEQRLLALQAAGVADQAPARAHDAVARHDDRDRVAVERAADGPRRARLPDPLARGLRTCRRARTGRGRAPPAPPAGRRGSGVRSTGRSNSVPAALEVLVELAPRLDRPVRRAQEHAGTERRGERVELVLGLGIEGDAADAALAGGDEQRSDRRVGEVVGDVEQPGRGRFLAEALVEAESERWSWGLLSPQPAHSGRGGRARRLGVRAERGADVVVGEVVAVAQHDGRPLGRAAARPARCSSSAYAGRSSCDGNLGRLGHVGSACAARRRRHGLRS